MTYQLEPKAVGEIRGFFFVPSYQRGYRWGHHDVTNLLDDIWAHQGKPYSLQPVVVKLRQRGESDAQHEWSLIDGQQRLTTLFLILRYMAQNLRCGMGAPYSLGYETRPNSASYLHALNEKDSGANSDFYHLYQATLAIGQWFQSKGDAVAQNALAIKLHSHLFDSVRVIWYEAPAATGDTASETALEIALFTRLNIGRIPLTDAELIKAALLSNIRKKSDGRVQEIAAQWDGIERDLHHKDIWAFIAGLNTATDDERYPTRISLLLNTLADEAASPPPGKRPSHYTFERLHGQIKQKPYEFWLSVVALHARILGWYEKPETYNRIGFLVARTKSAAVEFGEMVKVANHGKKTKRQFDDYLIQRIREKTNTNAQQIETLNYRKDAEQLAQLLLLMNVAGSTKSGERFPFARHVGEQWSLEHIHAQNSQQLTRIEQWHAWLREHSKALAAVKLEVDGTAIDQLQIKIKDACTNESLTKPSFEALSNEVLKFLNRDGNEVDDSIRNLALLGKEKNSSLSNAVFEVKRQQVLAWDRKGEYVPGCTRNVFLKYYAGANALQPHFWSDEDKKSYLDAIVEQLEHYLLPSELIGKVQA
jgi:hypothetical protein